MLIEGGAPKFTNCSFTHNETPYRGGAVAIVDDATPVFDGCDFSENRTSAFAWESDGGAVHVDHGEAQFTDCVFDDNLAMGEGGAVGVLHGAATLTACDFIANEAVIGSGGALRGLEATFDVLGCSFEANRSAFYGGAITVVWSDLSVALSGFLDSGALGVDGTERDGAAWASYSQTAFNACTFVDNHATDDGGAVVIAGYSAAFVSVFDGCTFTSNSAATKGGALSLGSGAATIESCMFSGNDAPQGGGINVETWDMDPNAASAVTSIHDCTFDGCTAFNGAGLRSSGRVEVSASIFTNNIAENVGGGIDLEQGGASVVRDTMFADNTAFSGAGVVANSPVCDVINCAFTGNNGEIGAGLICTLASASPRVINCTFSGNDAPLGAAAVGIGSGGHATLINCVMGWNSSGVNTGAVVVYSGSIDIANSVIAHNAGGGLLLGDFATSSMLSNSIVWANTNGAELAGSPLTVRYTNVQGGAPGIGTMNANPQFIAPLAGNFRLAPTSPCIDAGMNWAVPTDSADLDADGITVELTPIDFDGNPRIADRGAARDTGCGLAGIHLRRPQR
ncbi:MAG: right-handed parallel beta-helix repeat-containing protein [Phycisphaerae bacterium]|nr:right-handed parallel beta-helix repeat-containing protein [Phycisphaerae bacterium]